MNMDINLSYIRDADIVLSCNVLLADIEYTSRGALVVVRFFLHTSKGLERRNNVYNFDRYGDIKNFGKILTDTYEYARLVDAKPELRAAEKDLGEAVCKVIGLAVQKHFAKGE